MAQIYVSEQVRVNISFNVTVLTNSRKQSKRFSYRLDLHSFHAMLLIRADIMEMVSTSNHFLATFSDGTIWGLVIVMVLFNRMCTNCNKKQIAWTACKAANYTSKGFTITPSPCERASAVQEGNFDTLMVVF